VDVIALTGGIAAGKSTVAQRLSEHGAVVIDADSLAREAVSVGSPGLAAVINRFGSSVLDDDGALDRSALGRHIFSDAQARADLNAIVHPEVRRLYHEALREARSRKPAALIIYDVPLLSEARAHDEFSLVVVVDAPAEERVRRLVAHRGMTEGEARNRVEAQVSDKERRAMADIIVDSSGSRENTLQEADALWHQLRSRRSVGSAE
jgi:dephospho-CoA kinase